MPIRITVLSEEMNGIARETDCHAVGENLGKQEGVPTLRRGYCRKKRTNL